LTIQSSCNYSFEQRKETSYFKLFNCKYLVRKTIFEWW